MADDCNRYHLTSSPQPTSPRLSFSRLKAQGLHDLPIDRTESSPSIVPQPASRLTRLVAHIRFDMEIATVTPAALTREQQLQQWRDQRAVNKKPITTKSATQTHIATQPSRTVPALFVSP